MSFQGIVGQDIAINALKNALELGHVRGSYLFLGPEGVGKRTAAVEFAKAINCERGDMTDACSDCASCNRIDSMRHPDVSIVTSGEQSASIKIGNIRGLIYQASMKPYERGKRIFIVDDAEKMTEEAQNALLKMLEEPPENHILILVSSNVSGLARTIVSRCKIIRFYSLTSDEIKGLLEKRGADEKEAILFSHMSMGSPGRAMLLREKRLISRRDQVVGDFFLRRSALLREEILSGETEGDIEESLYLLLCWHRDLLVAKFTDEKAVLLNIDRAEEIFYYAARFSRSKLERDIEEIMKALEYIGRNINPKIALFNMAMELKRT